MTYTITYRDATGVRTDLGRLFDDASDASQVASGLALMVRLGVEHLTDIAVGEVAEPRTVESVLARNVDYWHALGGPRDDCRLHDPSHLRIRHHCSE